ncbi:hypothetical protein DFH06DRAFT_162189 [Mycena polygramma]|nr:hypothetical protein DFH06DRAFT_162189 [Mycena polygramma]
MEAAVMDALTLEDYHGLCSWYLPHSSSYCISAGVAIASLPWECFESCAHWRLLRHAPGRGAVLENGWRRFNTHDVVGCSLVTDWWLTAEACHWFSQANYIFNRCQITSNLNEYGSRSVPRHFVTCGCVEDLRQMMGDLRRLMAKVREIKPRERKFVGCSRLGEEL